jgi:hypothetical protein
MFKDKLIILRFEILENLHLIDGKLLTIRVFSKCQ